MTFAVEGVWFVQFYSITVDEDMEFVKRVGTTEDVQVEDRITESVIIQQEGGGVGRSQMSVKNGVRDMDEG